MPKDTFYNLKPEKRQLICDVALDEFGQFGVHGASLSRMVRHAGIAKGSFYQYFTDTTDLLLHLLFDMAHRKVAYLEAAIAQHKEDDFYFQLEKIYIASLQFRATMSESEHRFSQQFNHPETIPSLMSNQEVIAYRKALYQKLFYPMLERAMSRGEIHVEAEVAMAVIEHLSPMIKQYLQRAWPNQSLADLYADQAKVATAIRTFIKIIKPGLSGLK